MAFLKHAASALAKKALQRACGAEDLASVSAMNLMFLRFLLGSVLSGSIKIIVTKRNVLVIKLAKVVKAIHAAAGVTTEHKLVLALVWTARYVR